MWQNSEGVFPILDFWSIFYKQNCHNSKTGNYIDMKHEPVFN